MKGRFKDRAKQITLIVLFLIISTLTISLIAGRLHTQQILIVKKDGLKTEVPLDQQLDYFDKKEILSSEMNYFKGAVVTDPAQLKGKILLSTLTVGSPIPTSSLVTPKGAGQFAALMPKGRTVHLLSQATMNLPPISEGDLINIALTYKSKADDGSESIKTGMLMTNVKIYKVLQSNIYVDVSLEQDMVLSTASQLGTFIYQVPGQKLEICGKDTTNCSTSETIPPVIQQSDIFQDILNKTYSGVSTNVNQAVNGTSTEQSNNTNQGNTQQNNNSGNAGGASN